MFLNNVAFVMKRCCVWCELILVEVVQYVTYVLICHGVYVCVSFVCVLVLMSNLAAMLKITY